VFPARSPPDGHHRPGRRLRPPWGLDAGGQLGNGTNNDSNVPVPVLDLTDVTAIATTEDHHLAIRSFCDCGKRGDVVFTWGANFSGELGGTGKRVVR
jgi:alpha-tubulin suppressor-like RCC1 family protein